MKKISFHILRVGLAITFLWIGVLIFKQPQAWGGYLQPWAAGLLPFSLSQTMIATAILDIIIGFLLLIDLFVWIAALIGAIHLVVVLTVSGITDITVRDIAILSAIIAIMVDSLPKVFTDKIISWQNIYFCVANDKVDISMILKNSHKNRKSAEFLKTVNNLCRNSP